MRPGISGLLKEICFHVFDTTTGLVGTEAGNEKFGVGAGGDVSRKIDLEAEAAVFDVLKKHNFRPTVVAEEAGIIEGPDGYLVIDAVDGTTNATRAIPFTCCSLAYATGRKLSSVQAAAIMDLSNRDIYHAVSNMGSYKNEIAIQVNKATAGINYHDAGEMIIGLNLSNADPRTITRLMRVVSSSKHIRQFGANALELCYLASGLLDAYIDIRGKIRVTDVAAAYLVVKEAGGKLFAPNGSELDSSLTGNERVSFLAVSTDSLFSDLASIITNP